MLVLYPVKNLDPFNWKKKIQKKEKQEATESLTAAMETSISAANVNTLAGVQ